MFGLFKNDSGPGAQTTNLVEKEPRAFEQFRPKVQTEPIYTKEAREGLGMPSITEEKGRGSMDPESGMYVEEAEEPQPETLLDAFLHHTTFYRIHLAAFTLIPLITSGIFHAANGQYPVKYIDSLFMCYSAMTVTGLSVINLSTITVGQQVILFLLMLIGDITTVSWIMVLIRKRFFRTHCEYAASRHKHRKIMNKLKNKASKLSISGPVKVFRPRVVAPETNIEKETKAKKRKGYRNSTATSPGIQVEIKSPTPGTTMGSGSGNGNGYANSNGGVTSILRIESTDTNRSSARPIIATTLNASPTSSPVELAESPAAESPRNEYGVSSGRAGSVSDYGMTSPHLSATSGAIRFNSMVERGPDGRLRPKRGATMLAPQSTRPGSTFSTKEKGNGGFPGPIDLLNLLLRRAAPKTVKTLERKLTMTSYQTLDEKDTSWLNFSGLVVGRNSDFRTETLSDEQLEQLGGAEYKALRLLSYFVPAYFIGCQLVSFILFAPWISTTNKYDSVFEAQPKLVNKAWFSLFQVMAAYTGGGMSLVDAGMSPFQNAYLMILGMIFSILAGNHALPIFMRCIIYLWSRVAKAGSGAHQALTFLLDHPRRCYLYLFPSHQTWFLFLALIGFSIIEWGSFLVLDIGIPAYESIPMGIRVLAGLFQGLAARASGFSIVPLASFAPSLLFLYIVMMYIAIYPVAVSIRSTNVYEERSLGVFEAPPDDEEEDPEIGDLTKVKSRKERVGRYVSWHVRKQMSIDIWWLVWGVFLVCVMERANLMDEDKKWFDLFRVLFEMVSAFGGIGLTLGLPYDNFAFCGSWRVISKLVVIVIMIRGRHRGLPVAVDRAVQLPREMVTQRPLPKRRNATLNMNDLVLPPPPEGVEVEDQGTAQGGQTSEGTRYFTSPILKTADPELMASPTSLNGDHEVRYFASPTSEGGGAELVASPTSVNANYGMVTSPTSPNVQWAPNLITKAG